MDDAIEQVGIHHEWKRDRGYETRLEEEASIHTGDGKTRICLGGGPHKWKGGGPGIELCKDLRVFKKKN